MNPNGGETLIKDSSVYIIRWGKNTNDLVRIELFKNGVSAGIIKDSLNAQTNAFAWIIANKIPADSIYKIRVTNVSYTELYGESNNVFTIIEKETSVKESNQKEFQLEIKPNPAINNITISLNSELLAVGQEMSISIVDSRGMEVKRFDSKDMMSRSSINFSVEKLSSGIYYCALTIGSNTVTKSFVVVK